MSYPRWLTKPRAIGPRPRWRQIVCLDCIAIRGRESTQIVVPGWAVIALLIISPLVILFYAPWLAKAIWCSSRNAIRARWRRREADRFGGLYIYRRNAAAMPWWPQRRASLSEEPRVRLEKGGTAPDGMKCHLLSLPVELRDPILTYVLRPAPGLLVNYDWQRERLLAIAIPDSAIETIGSSTESAPPGLTLANSCYPHRETAYRPPDTLPARSPAQHDADLRNNLEWFQAYKPVESILPILQTCRQLYTEGVRILYGANTFHFTLAPDKEPCIASGGPHPVITGSPVARFVAFCASLPATHRSRIRYVRLSFRCHWEYDGKRQIFRFVAWRNWARTCGYLRRMTGLKTLEIRFKKSNDVHPSCEALGAQPGFLSDLGQKAAVQLLWDLVGVRATKKILVSVPRSWGYVTWQIPPNAGFEVVLEREDE
ncbi:hypothetical protein Tdes44962_MAKER03668 [Teratosphaeria destructans]|uniref:DUF7730 domain-containing protein n=1 Tax=Teratosphaeria destructans TaxID=418781 RepID=A0A9W7SPF5_9PEZI|nr:hypothetical protein Tdes44962_MAKER03668 [Teratosphaeria destructans]